MTGELLFDVPETSAMDVPGRLEERFDTVLSVLFIWFIAGVFSDGHNHVHGAPVTFFTPEHGLFYSAFLATFSIFGYFLYRGWKREGQPLEGLPGSHRLTLYGLVMFFAGGFGDMLWHGAFGIESTTEALYSPTHLLLAAGASVFVSGPLRNLWDRDLSRNWREQFPVLTSSAVLLSVFTFMTMYAHLMLRPFGASWYSPATASGATAIPAAAGIEIGMLSVMVQSAFLAGFALLLSDRFDLVPGALTYVLGLNAAGMAFLSGNYVLLPGFLLAAALSDIVYMERIPARGSTQFRAFAFLVPAMFHAAYFATLFLAGGVTWSVHLWPGAIFLAGITGLLLSYVMEP
ncbi:MAG: hypothetical protein ABEK00_03875 [Candidatus Nanohaloarchaea archaeon]